MGRGAGSSACEISSRTAIGRCILHGISSQPERNSLLLTEAAITRKGVVHASPLRPEADEFMKQLSELPD
jgi:hypothetical protein